MSNLNSTCLRVFPIGTAISCHTCTSDIFLFNLDPHPSEYNLSDFYNITINFLIIQSGIVYKSLSSVSYDAELLDVTGHLKDLPLIPMPKQLRSSE